MMALDPDTFEITKSYQTLEITFMNPDHKDEAMRDIIHAIPCWFCGDERARKIKISELDQLLDKGLTYYWERIPPWELDEDDDGEAKWRKKRGYLLLYYSMAKVDGKWLTLIERDDIWLRVKPVLAARMKEIVEREKDILKQRMDQLDQSLEEMAKLEA